MWKCNLKYIKSNLYFAFIYLPVSKRKLIQLIILGEQKNAINNTTNNNKNNNKKC